MPHVIVQATPNVTIKKPESLLKKLNTTLWETGHIGSPQAIKSRMLDIENFLVGTEDDLQTQGFVYLQLRLLPGRSQEVRNEMAQKLHQCLQDDLVPLQSGRVKVQYLVEVIELTEVYQNITI